MLPRRREEALAKPLVSRTVIARQMTFACKGYCVTSNGVAIALPPICGPGGCNPGNCNCPSGRSQCGNVGACYDFASGCDSLGSPGCKQHGKLSCTSNDIAVCDAQPRTSGPCADVPGGTCNSNGICIATCPAGTSRCSENGLCLNVGQACTSSGSGGCEQSGALVCGDGGQLQCNAQPRTSGACGNGGTCNSDGNCAAPRPPEVAYQLQWYHAIGGNYSSDLCFPSSGTPDGSNIHEVYATGAIPGCAASPCGPGFVRYGDCQVAHLAGGGHCEANGTSPSRVRLGWASDDPSDCGCVVHFGAGVFEGGQRCQITAMRVQSAR